MFITHISVEVRYVTYFIFIAFQTFRVAILNVISKVSIFFIQIFISGGIT